MYTFATKDDEPSVTQELHDGNFVVWSLDTSNGLSVKLISTGNSYHRPVLSITLPSNILSELFRRGQLKNLRQMGIHND